jgi:TonB family protein
VITLTQQPKPPGRGVAVSTALHVVACVLIVQFGGAILAPPVHRTGATLVFIPSPRTVPEPAPLPKPKLRAFKLPKLPRPEPVQIARRPALIEAPAIQAEPVPPVRPAPAIQVPAPPQIAAAPPVRPAPAVQVGEFSQQKLLNEPERKPRLTAQPAGFDSGDQTRKVQNEPTRLTAIGGFTNTAVTRTSGRPLPAAISDGAFGSASAGAAARRQPAQEMARAGFGDTLAAKPQSAPAQVNARPSDSTPVEITFRPRPAYTEEARRAQIEGEVLVEAVFTASGEVRVVRILRGLPHGLNETALAAVRAIRFHPARRGGEPVDATATVRMNFELAY